MAAHWVYVVRCADGTYYTGYTTDVERRVAEHDAGEGAKYTRG
ncbi:MAG: GIY-YIG nuclease family protein, partial [Actinobacteria bacterium]|nr:GIY-YIG nuclease family protein [Actinomycetota bacterium]